MTSSTKPEVHDLSQLRHGRTEPWPQTTCKENLVKFGRVVSSFVSGQTDRQTDRQIYKQTNKQRYTFITILRTPSGGEVIVNIIVIESSGLVWGYVHIIDVKQKGKNGRKYA